MCCRYFMEESPELRPYVEAARRSALADEMIAHLGRPLVTSGEVRPTDVVPVLAPDRNGRPAVFPMVWGFTGKTSSLFNARSETASRKPTFRECWERRRCVIPASYYFEWQHFTSPDGKTKTGAKYMIQPKGATMTLLAGLYRIEEDLDIRVPHFTVLTREPSEDLRVIHDRMPVILSQEAAASWLRPETGLSLIRTISEHSLLEMIAEPQEYPQGA